MTRKVFIINPNGQYISMFNNHDDYLVVENMEEADLIQFTGGSDVTPALYGEKAHPHTYNSPQRDANEHRLYDDIIKLNIPMAGICRGGQFLHVMNGGKMYQHVDGHCIAHKIRDVWTNEIYEVSSTHHQMMRDSYVEDGCYNDIIAIAEGVCSSYAKESMNKGLPVYELEVIHYPITNSLCFQPHPEFDGYQECRDLYFQYLNEYLFNRG